ncbi:hypothetical protein AB1Y20_007327 [Prymnesium parvum]|uniref:Uncharacterized protein n=1 Tax=Prymnesium parvum TaxID=97485 RepID=A0AB34IWW9_PRYPA
MPLQLRVLLLLSLSAASALIRPVPSAICHPLSSCAVSMRASSDEAQAYTRWVTRVTIKSKSSSTGMLDDVSGSEAEAAAAKARWLSRLEDEARSAQAARLSAAAKEVAAREAAAKQRLLYAMKADEAKAERERLANKLAVAAEVRLRAEAMARMKEHTEGVHAAAEAAPREHASAAVDAEKAARAQEAAKARWLLSRYEDSQALASIARRKSTPAAQSDVVATAEVAAEPLAAARGDVRHAWVSEALVAARNAAEAVDVEQTLRTVRSLAAFTVAAGGKARVAVENSEALRQAAHEAKVSLQSWLAREEEAEVRPSVTARAVGLAVAAVEAAARGAEDVEQLVVALDAAVEDVANTARAAAKVEKQAAVAFSEAKVAMASTWRSALGVIGLDTLKDERRRLEAAQAQAAAYAQAASAAEQLAQKLKEEAGVPRRAAITDVLPACEATPVMGMRFFHDIHLLPAHAVQSARGVAMDLATDFATAPRRAREAAVARMEQTKAELQLIAETLYDEVKSDVMQLPAVLQRHTLGFIVSNVQEAEIKRDEARRKRDNLKSLIAFEQGARLQRAPHAE